MVNKVALMEIIALTVETKTTSISDYVAKVIMVLQKEGIGYEITSVGTIVEGS